MKKDDDVPFSYLVKVGHISANPVEVTLSADAEERAGLAELWSVMEVKALDATFTVQRWKRDGVRLTVIEVIYHGGNPEAEPPE